MNQFKEIKPGEIKDNVFSLIGKDWMLVTAKAGDQVNTMTASWGGAGILWGKEVAFVFVRPSRYTYSLIEQTDTFTLTFFEENYRSALNYNGSHSGRDEDKIAKSGLTPLSMEDSVIFEEARMAMVCKKLYRSDITPDCFTDPEIEKFYNGEDYHCMYIVQIQKVLVK